MAIEISDLKRALVTAEHRSLRRAAEALNIRQSTLSRRLRDLELRVGVVLFMRSYSGTRPTIAGQKFLETARRIVRDVEEMTVQLRAQSRGESGQLTIGIHASLSAGNLRTTLIEHRQRFPQVETFFVDGTSNHLISDVADAALDVAFVAAEVRNWEDGSLPVWSERVVIALPENHPLGTREFVRWDDLASEFLLVPRRGPGPEFLKLLIGKIGFPNTGRFLWQDVGLDRLLTLVGAGWGTLIALEGATAVNCPGVVFREVHDADGSTKVNFYAYWRLENSNPSLFPFLDMLRDRYPAPSIDGREQSRTTAN